MPKEEQQFITGLIGGSLVLLMLGVFLLLFLLIYQRRHNAHLREKTRMRTDFEDNLAQTQMEVQEQTRRQLAVELHDNIGQILSLTNVTLASIDLGNHERAAGKIGDAQDLIARSIRELRRLSRVLHGELLVREGLVEAVRKDVEWLENKEFYKIRLDIRSGGCEFEREDVNLFVYRIFQESLNNILKHSQANTITILLHYDYPVLSLTIADDGRGFDPAAMPAGARGLGLNNIRKRVELLSGTMDLRTAPGEGCSLFIQIPYSDVRTNF